jgi:hypothetical protein
MSISEPCNDTAEVAADHVQAAAPRLVKVTAVTAISFALFDGANRALLDLKDVANEVSEIAAGYRGDTIAMTAVRLALLLDRDPRTVSFQSVYRRLERQDVVEALVNRICCESLLASVLSDRIEDNARSSVVRFLSTYRAIDWRDVHGRLVHFRNRGLAHLTPEAIEKRITYAEIRSLVHSVTLLGECVMPFDPTGVPLRDDEIADWSDRAKSAWKASFRGQALRC